MEGWSRDMYFDATGLPWVMPSPNMPTLDTAIVYPGTVLFEGTMLSEGRGTTRPFELIGAPWLDGGAFAARMNERGLQGVHFRPAVFEPTFQKHAKTAVRRLPDPRHRPRQLRPGRGRGSAAPRVLRPDPAQFEWRLRLSRIRCTKMPIDILAGSPALREQIEGRCRSRRSSRAGRRVRGVPPRLERKTC